MLTCADTVHDDEHPVVGQLRALPWTSLGGNGLQWEVARGLSGGALRPSMLYSMIVLSRFITYGATKEAREPPRSSQTCEYVYL